MKILQGFNSFLLVRLIVGSGAPQNERREAEKERERQSDN